MRKISRGIMLILVLVLTFQMSVYAKDNDDDLNYVRDADQTVYTSENGLLGTATKCILAAEDGRMWIGSYTGLYIYDGTEFAIQYMDGRMMVANCITQTANGDIWIGTNGDGLYRYRDGQFKKCETGARDELSNVIRDIVELPDGTIWVATKKGLFYFTEGQCQEKKSVLLKNDTYIQDMELLNDGRIACVTKSGTLFYIDNGEIKLFTLGKYYDNYKIRSIGHDDTHIYLGSTGHELLRMEIGGKVERIITCDKLTAFNNFYEISDDTFWVCCDTGIGILKGNTLTYQNFAIDNSVEDVCMDYQGGFWFVSSRQGVLKITPNVFANLSNYFEIKQTVNAMMHDDGHLYLGTDEGLFCYDDNIEVKDDPLVKRLGSQRIRQIFRDEQTNEIWVATYQSGIYHMQSDGKIEQFTDSNSRLTTDQIRCIREGNDGVHWIGTEDGLFMMYPDHEIEKFDTCKDIIHERIMDVYENADGVVYIATDGYGVFVVKDDSVTRINKSQGMLSDITMKLEPSKLFEGVWAVTGSEICLIGYDNSLTWVRGIPASNCLDLLLNDTGEAYIVAGNGFFKTEEKELLKRSEPAYEWYTKENGLPIDFTANGFPSIYEDNVFLCGTEGAAFFHHSFNMPEKKMQIYVKDIQADGESVYSQDKSMVLSSDVRRLNFDIRMLQYTTDEYEVAYRLAGMEDEFTWVKEDNLKEISYTNLPGGKYTYMIKVYEKGTDNCLCELNIPFIKNYAYFENPKVHILMISFFVLMGCFIISFVMYLINRHQKHNEKKQYEAKRKEELARVAYKDMVTGVNNRNLFEMDKMSADMDKLTVVVTVSIDFFEYMLEQYGRSKTESIMIQAVNILKANVSEKTRIYRISETVFLIWFTEPVDTEAFALAVKGAFAETGSEEEPRVLSVGAAFYDREQFDSMESLIDYCEKLRLMDEKHSYTKFMQGKVKFL